MYVGGWSSGGKLVAHLSDGSAVDYVNTSFSSSTGYYRLVYTLTYRAASAGQQLVVQWTQTSGTGNVKLQAVALAGPPVPANVSASDGTSATSVTVTWSASSGATSYTVYRSTSVGTLGSSIGTTNNLSFTDTTVTAGTLYYYSVVATSAGGNSAPSAQDSGYAGIFIPGSLAGSGVASFAAVDLTATGTSDWAKWPNYIHKASGGAQIPDFTQIGTAAPQTYNNDQRPISWSDGTPTATGTNDISGISIRGIGNGFQLTAPADTATRTLYVYVGGWSSGGKLVAHLSDGSAVDYVNTSFSSSNGILQAVYTLTYRAASAGQQLVVQWTQTSGTGNVKLQAVALAGPPVPANVSASDGTSATSVTVTWSPSSGATSYTVYRSTSVGTLGSSIGTTNNLSFTDTTVTAGTLYYYSVVATSAGGNSAPSAQDSGYAGIFIPGSLAGSGVASFAAVNLTATGTSDWAKWPNHIHKASGGAQIPNFTQIGAAAPQTYNNDTRPISWSDGTPTATGTNDITGNSITGIGNGFQLTVPADTATRTLYLYVGGWSSAGNWLRTCPTAVPRTMSIPRFLRAPDTTGWFIR